jgi:hypothetical protein
LSNGFIAAAGTARTTLGTLKFARSSNSWVATISWAGVTQASRQSSNRSSTIIPITSVEDQIDDTYQAFVECVG